MALVTLNFSLSQARQTMIGSLRLDALLSVSAEFNSNATEYPVETGVSISDHITISPMMISLTGVVSSATTTLYGQAGRHRLVETENLLRDLINARQTIQVMTDLNTYPDMAFESGTVSRDNSGDHISIECRLKQIRKVNLQQTEIPPDIVAADARGRAGGTVNAGRTNGGTPTEEQKEQMQSDLHGMIFGASK